MFQIRKCFRHPVKIRSVGQTQSHSAPRAEGVAGTHHSVCRGRSVSRLSPSPSLQVFAQHHFDNMQWGCKGVTSAPKSVAERLWGWETIPFMQPSTIRRYCAHHSRSYFSHPDEEGERQFRFGLFGRPWAFWSVLSVLWAPSLVWTWPLMHFLVKISTGRRISAQRQPRRATTTYGALHALHTTTVQFGPVWEKILSPLQMDTPYKI